MGRQPPLGFPPDVSGEILGRLSATERDLMDVLAYLGAAIYLSLCGWIIYISIWGKP